MGNSELYTERLGCLFVCLTTERLRASNMLKDHCVSPRQMQEAAFSHLTVQLFQGQAQKKGSGNQNSRKYEPGKHLTHGNHFLCQKSHFSYWAQFLKMHEFPIATTPELQVFSGSSTLE